MSGDFETLEINQPKIKYLKPEDNTEWLDKLINNIEDMKNKISKDSQKFKKETFYLIFSLTASNYVSFLIKATVVSHFIKCNLKFMVDFSWSNATDS